MSWVLLLLLTADRAQGLVSPGSPRDVIASLASHSAGYINGALLYVNGGG